MADRNASPETKGFGACCRMVLLAGPGAGPSHPAYSAAMVELSSTFGATDRFSQPLQSS